ncbi:MAG: hypothetical protein [aquatic viral metagenome]
MLLLLIFLKGELIQLAVWTGLIIISTPLLLMSVELLRRTRALGTDIISIIIVKIIADTIIMVTALGHLMQYIFTYTR